MSAFAGFLNLDSAPADPRLVEVQMARLRHRGPDGLGTYANGPAALGHALLSITPESVAEKSPWRSVDGQRVIAFDGRLDHRDDLCGRLGVPFAERSVPDPELILRAYEKWGTECAVKLEGEFAFALWDARRQEMFCACDVFALRSLFYHVTPSRFVFASEIRGVLAIPGVPRALDEGTLACELSRVPRTAGRTFYSGISRLPGARSLTVRPHCEPEVRPYWQLSMEPEIRLSSSAEYSQALRELLERSVRSALRTYHPVAAMVSGGLDSTGVAALAARELARRGESLTTVSNVLPEDYQGSEWSREESRFIRSALDMYPNMDPQWARGLANPVVKFEDSYYLRHDEPDADPKSFRTSELFHLAEQRGARIILGGMGGDKAASFRGSGYLELLARRMRWFELVRQVRLQAAARNQTATGIFRREVLRRLSPSMIVQWNDRLRHGRSPESGSFAVNPRFAARMGIAELRIAAERLADLHADFRIPRLAMVNAGQLDDDGLWVNRHSPRLECPQPLLDRRIWEWCYRIPVGEFVSGGIPRNLYRRALHDVLPDEILHRLGKGWFAPDYQRRFSACRPEIEAFLARYPADAPVWEYVSRAKVEETMCSLDCRWAKDQWDSSLQLILYHGLTLAHFVGWLRAS